MCCVTHHHQTLHTQLFNLFPCLCDFSLSVCMSVCLGCRMPSRCSGTDESFSLCTWPGPGPGWAAYYAHSQDIAGSSTHTPPMTTGSSILSLDTNIHERTTLTCIPSFFTSCFLLFSPTLPTFFLSLSPSHFLCLSLTSFSLSSSLSFPLFFHVLLLPSSPFSPPLPFPPLPSLILPRCGLLVLRCWYT